MAKRAGIQPFKPSDFPVKCASCFKSVEHPKVVNQRPPEEGPHRRPVHRRIGKQWRICCSFCYPLTGMSDSWVKQFGHSDVNGMPVNENRKPCRVEDAFGFRKYKFKGGERVPVYVKKKA